VRVALVAAGGGCGAIGQCFRFPGASRTFVEAAIPYDRAAMADYLGGLPNDPSASAARARQLAVRAVTRSEAWSKSADPPVRGTLGVACTAALPSPHARHNQNRIHVVVFGPTFTWQASATWETGRHDRASAERLADAMIFTALARAAEVDFGRDVSPQNHASLEIRQQPSQPSWRQLRRGEIPYAGDLPDEALLVLCGPGPIQASFIQTAERAAKLVEKPVRPVLSLSCGDGLPPLDDLTLAERIAEAETIAAPILFWSAGLEEKARAFPGRTFVVSAEAARSVTRDASGETAASTGNSQVDQLVRWGCRLLIDGNRDEAEVRPPLTGLCEFLTPAPESSLTHDLSES
jgi:hypothetical protein